VAGLV
jgi:hypothetical protein